MTLKMCNIEGGSHSFPQASQRRGKVSIRRFPRGGGCELGVLDDGKKERGGSLFFFPFPAFPVPFGIPSPQPPSYRLKRSRQHKRSLCGGEKVDRM